MKRAFWMTVCAGAVGAVAAGLAREARTLGAPRARLLLLGLCLFLVFEWAAHLIGSRLSRANYPRADRAAFAALSSAGIWIVLLSAFPMVLQETGIDPVGPCGIALTTVAATAGLSVRLWFLREIYQVNLKRAAGLWAASRGTVLLLLGIAVGIWTFGGAGLPALRIGP